MAIPPIAVWTTPTILERILLAPNSYHLFRRSVIPAMKSIIPTMRKISVSSDTVT